MNIRRSSSKLLIPRKMKFKEFVKQFSPQTEESVVKKISGKLEDQYYNACLKAKVNPEESHPEIILKVDSDSQVPMLFFEKDSKRISMFMFFLPTGDLILTENPENYAPVVMQKLGYN
jgi:hypothetical protein